MIDGVLYSLYELKMKDAFVYDVQLKPVYIEETGKLKGWEVSYWAVERKICPVRIQFKQFFKETWFRDSECAAHRFKNKLLSKQNENTK